MSGLANEILEMTDGEIREINTPRVHSRDQLNNSGLCTGDVRVDAGLIVMSDDLDEEREELAKRKERYSRKNRRQERNSEGG